MSPKTGRPLKDNPKDKRIQIRLDKETLETLDKCAKVNSTTRSEVIRQGIGLVYAEIQKKK